MFQEEKESNAAEQGGREFKRELKGKLKPSKKIIIYRREMSAFYSKCSGKPREKRLQREPVDCRA